MKVGEKRELGSAASSVCAIIIQGMHEPRGDEMDELSLETTGRPESYDRGFGLRCKKMLIRRPLAEMITILECSEIGLFAYFHICFVIAQFFMLTFSHAKEGGGLYQALKNLSVNASGIEFSPRVHPTRETSRVPNNVRSTKMQASKISSAICKP